jgi:hypothetical protein
MQMRCVCTEVTLGLKEATRSGVQSDINASAELSDSVTYKCANVALITQQSYLIVAPQRDERC